MAEGWFNEISEEFHESFSSGLAGDTWSQASSPPSILSAPVEGFICGHMLNAAVQHAPALFYCCAEQPIINQSVINDEYLFSTNEKSCLCLCRLSAAIRRILSPVRATPPTLLFVFKSSICSQQGFLGHVYPATRGEDRWLTCALLLQPADLGVQPLQRVGVVLLQEEQVLLRAVQLILQGQVGRRHG